MHPNAALQGDPVKGKREVLQGVVVGGQSEFGFLRKQGMDLGEIACCIRH